MAIPRYLPSPEPEGDINFLVGRTMAEELLRSGPRRLAFAALIDERQAPFGPPRYEGMTAAARAHGLPTPERLDIPLKLAGAKAALDAFTAGGSPMGVGCYNDDVAIAVLAAGRRSASKRRVTSRWSAWTQRRWDSWLPQADNDPHGERCAHGADRR